MNFLLTINQLIIKECGYENLKKIITKRKCPDLLSNYLKSLKEMYGNQSGEFVCRYWCLRVQVGDSI